MSSLQSGITSRIVTINSGIGTIAVNDISKSADTEVGVVSVVSEKSPRRQASSIEEEV